MVSGWVKPMEGAMCSPVSERTGDGRAGSNETSGIPDDSMARLVADLRQSNADLEQFAYMVSHDLREPLRMVTSYAQLLERRCAGQLDGEAIEFLHYLTDGARRMERMIEDILRFARAGRSAALPSAFSSRDALDAALEDLGAAMEEVGGAVTVGTMPDIVADRSQVERLFENLLGNALKYHRPGIPPVIHVEGGEIASGWQFSVSDNGEGIAAADHQAVFKLFERLHGRDKPGTGLGLAICKKIVDHHGGRIWVESTPGEGATFYFTLGHLPAHRNMP